MSQDNVVDFVNIADLANAARALSASGACTALTAAERRPDTNVPEGHIQLAAEYLTVYETNFDAGRDIVSMGKEDFRQALSDFTFDVASGGAIRHLTDLGYTVKQIQEQMDFPTPIARIREGVWKRLVETGVIFLEEPRQQAPMEKVNYVREYDSYGKASFRRVVETDPQPETAGAFLVCEFGLLRYRDGEKYRKVLEVLDERQAEYIDGLPWPLKKVWYRADERMLEIERRLRAAGLEQGVCHTFCLKQ